MIKKVQKINNILNKSEEETERLEKKYGVSCSHGILQESVGKGQRCTRADGRIISDSF